MNMGRKIEEAEKAVRKKPSKLGKKLAFSVTAGCIGIMLAALVKARELDSAGQEREAEPEDTAE